MNDPATMSLWMLVATIAMAIATAGAAIAASLYTKLTRDLLRGQVDPKVIVYVRHDRDRRTILNINVENIGRDIAYDVRFSASGPIPEKAWGIETASAPVAPTMMDGPLISGIPALGPGDKRDITWGQYGGLTKALGGKPIVLDYEYRTRAGRKLSGQAILEVESYIGTSANETPAAESAKHLRNIADTAAKMARSITELSDEVTGKNVRTRAWLDERRKSKHAAAPGQATETSDSARS